MVLNKIVRPPMKIVRPPNNIVRPPNNIVRPLKMSNFWIKFFALRKLGHAKLAKFGLLTRNRLFSFTFKIQK
jgi:hypothetical protein